MPSPQTKTIKTEKLFRALQFERSAVNEEARTVELSFSSETPYERWFGMEILDHSPGSIRLGRLNNGGAVLVDHHGDQVGVVDSAEIGPGRKGRAVLRFGKGQRADEVFQDVKDDIRRNVSVGYIIHKMQLESETDGVETYRVTDWEPYEISIVGIPADTTVGVGRSAENHRDHETIIEYRSQTMPAPTPEPTPTAPVTVTPTPDTNGARSAGVTSENTRTCEILNMGIKHGMVTEAERAIKDHTSVDAFRQAVIDKLEAAGGSPIRQIKVADIGMNAKETKRYSIVRAMNQLASKKALDGLEREASDAVAKLIGRDAQGFFIPHDVQARALEVGSATAGGYLVDDDNSQPMIEMLRNAMAIEQMGARRLTGLMGNVPIPKQASGATAQWCSEDEEASDSDQNFGQILLSPHRIAAVTKFSKQLLAQASIDVEAFVRADLAAVIALAIDLGALAGTGGKQPLGLLNLAGVNELTFGGAPTWADIVNFETLVETDNVAITSGGFITTAGVKGAWKTTEKATGTAQWLWDKANTVNGYKAAVSAQVPSNRVVFGNWTDMIMALWEGMDVVVDPYTLAANNQVRIVVNQFADVGVRHAVSFARSTDAGNQ